MPRPNFPAKQLFPQAKPPLRANRLLQRTSIYPGRNCQRPRQEYPKCQIDSSKVQPVNHDDLPVQCESERASSEPSPGRRQSLPEKERPKRQGAERENFRKTDEQMRSPKNRARRSGQRKRSPLRPSASHRRCVTCPSLAPSIGQVKSMLCSRTN